MEEKKPQVPNCSPKLKPKAKYFARLNKIMRTIPVIS